MSQRAIQSLETGREKRLTIQWGNMTMDINNSQKNKYIQC